MVPCSSPSLQAAIKPSRLLQLGIKSSTHYMLGLEMLIIRLDERMVLDSCRAPFSQFQKVLFFCSTSTVDAYLVHLS